jgi:hypothetical protein
VAGAPGAADGFAVATNGVAGGGPAVPAATAAAPVGRFISMTAAARARPRARAGRGGAGRDDAGGGRGAVVFAGISVGAAGGAGAGGGGRGGAAAPTADSHLYAAQKNKPLTMAAPGLLPATAAPAAGAGAGAPARTAALDAPPQHGKVAIKPDGSFVYTPNKDYVGTDTFTYKVTAGATTSAAGTVTVTVK